MMLSPIGNCDPGPSVFFADTIGLRAAGALALFALGMALYYRLRARRARGAAGLAEGPAVVHGRVVAVNDEGAATTRAPVSIRWTGPFVPQVDLQPMYVLLGSGERVRVDPPRSVEWTEGLEDAEPLIRAAFPGGALRPEARVTLYGSLRAAPDPRGGPAGGYRDAARAWELVPNERGVLLFSLRAPGSPEERLARFHTRWAVGLVLGLLAVQLTVLLNYNAVRAFGERVELPVVESRIDDARTDSGDALSRDYLAVDYAAPDGQHYRLGYQTRGWDYALTGARTAPWIVVPALPRAFHQIGEAPTAPWYGLAIAGCGFAVAFGFYLVTAARRAGWYRGQRSLLARWSQA